MRKDYRGSRGEGGVAITLRTGGEREGHSERERERERLWEENKTRQPQQRKERKEMKEDGGVVYERTAPGGG